MLNVVGRDESENVMKHSQNDQNFHVRVDGDSEVC